jgi:pilus assembly protein CpaB
MLAMYLVYQYLDSKDQEMKDQFGTFYPMVIASRDILQYESIRPTDIELVRVPKKMDPPGRISDPKDVIDAVAAVPIMKGEQILDNKVISKNIYSGLDTQITVGKRAVSIPVNVKSAVGYMLRPGNRIDLAAHFEYKSTGAAISEVKIFMEDLLVLASGRTIQPNPPKGVDQSIVRGVMNGQSNDSYERDVRETLNFAKTDPNYQTVTLEVTPRQAQQIVYVMTVFGDSIVCLLRHSDDRVLPRTPTTNLFDVMGPDSFLVRGNKLPPPRNIPRPKFYDYVGDQLVPVNQ